MKARDQDEEENQSNGEPPFPPVSANTLARCLGVTPKVIYDLTKEGVIERGPGRLFQLEDSVRRYCEHLRRQTGRSSCTFSQKANPSRLLKQSLVLNSEN